MDIIKCTCNNPSCNTSLSLTADGYLIIREYHINNHHIASIKLPGPLAAYIRIHIRTEDK